MSGQFGTKRKLSVENRIAPFGTQRNVHHLNPREVEEMTKFDVPIEDPSPRKKTRKKKEFDLGALHMSRDRVFQWKRGDFISSVEKRETTAD